MLELLPCSLLVTIRYRPIVDLLHIWETVDDESAQQNSVADLVALNRQAHQIGQSFEFRNLDKAVDVVVLKEEALEFLETLELGDVARPDDIVEPYILE